ncbi:MAG: Helix-turn-helix domain [Frankiales bacterium]|nr:Helix-turn-helix domain [Frankiales bacterium]
MYALDGSPLVFFHEHVSFGDLLRSKRQQQGLTQAELALALGVQQQAVGRWELDKDLPRRETIRLIAHRLSMSGSEIAVALGFVDEHEEGPSQEFVPLPPGIHLTPLQRAAIDSVLNAFLESATMSNVG